MIDYPVGSTWQYVDEKHGYVLTVWRNDHFWLWSFNWKDGSGYKQDWMPDKARASAEARSYAAGRTRTRAGNLKRIK